MEPFGDEPANFGKNEVTDRNQSVSNSTALANDLNSQTPLRKVIILELAPTFKKLVFGAELAVKGESVSLARERPLRAPD